MDFKNKITQWNCRGLRPNYNEILLLLSLLRPSVFCLQEVFLKPDDNIVFKRYNLYNYIYKDGHKPSGGSSILIHPSCPQREINHRFASCCCFCYFRKRNNYMFCLYTSNFCFTLSTFRFIAATTSVTLFLSG